MNDNEFKLLSEIKEQIERFDGKANVLSAISGVLLGLSFGWIAIFKNTLVLPMKIITYFLFIFIFLYILFLCLAIFIFIWSVLPRSRPKKINKEKTNNSVLYYKDLQKMEISIIKDEILQNKEKDLLEQIKINSVIATKKHKMVVCGSLFLILSVLSIVISVSFYMFI